MKTKTIFLTFCSTVLFTAITYAQCTTSSINAAELTAGQKVILTEISKEDDPEIHKAMIGKTLTVGAGGMANIGECWFMGELNINGDDVFFIGVRLDAVKGESYGATTPPVATETKAASDFPVGAKVLVYGIPSANPSPTAMFSDKPTPVEQDKGEVVEADLKKNANGTYDGCILDKYGWDIGFRRKVCFTGKKVELIK